MWLIIIALARADIALDTAYYQDELSCRRAIVQVEKVKDPGFKLRAVCIESH